MAEENSVGPVHRKCGQTLDCVAWGWNMEKRALKLEAQVPAILVELSANVAHDSASKLIPYPPLVSIPFAAARDLQTRERRRRKRFLSFIKLELAVFVLLLLFLAAAGSKSVAETGLTLSARIAVVVDALMLAIIPVIFYGSTRPKYRARRYRTH